MFRTALKRTSPPSKFRHYVYFVLSTGTFQTYGTWKKQGGDNPFAAPDYRSDMVTRTQIVDIFFSDA